MISVISKIAENTISTVFDREGHNMDNGPENVVSPSRKISNRNKSLSNKKSGSFDILSCFGVTRNMGDKKEQQAVVQGTSDFTNKLYRVLAKEKGNVFFSPISVHAVLSMASQGSKGATYEALAKTLGISDASAAAEGYKTVMEDLNNVSRVELSMANKIYIKRNYELKRTFQKITQNKYLSDVEPVNFEDSQGSAKNINGWVEKKTKNKIKDLIQPEMIDSDTRLVLVNAIYFKGTWADPFDAERTITDKFYINDNDSIDVQMMRKTEDYFYKEDKKLDAKVLELPYSNPDVSLIVILPNKQNGIGELENKLADFDLTKITENMYETEVIVKLPRFKIKTTIDLNGPLEELGLGIIFDPGRADFSEMLKSPEPLVVSQVIQKAFIEVNEEGTEAAAATGTMMLMALCGRIEPDPEEFFADHPFILLLAYRKQSILFHGRVFAPKE